MRKAFAAAGVDPAVVYTDMGITAGEEALDRLFEINPRITAIVTSGDSVGVGAVQRLRAAGRRVPEDVSILSIGTTYFGQLSTPKLTAIDLNLSECCAAAVNYISDILDGYAPPDPKPRPVSLVPGQSVRQLGKPRRRPPSRAGVAP